MPSKQHNRKKNNKPKGLDCNQGIQTFFSNSYLIMKPEMPMGCSAREASIFLHAAWNGTRNRHLLW